MTLADDPRITKLPVVKKPAVKTGHRLAQGVAF
jgi:hypothetical protein